MTQPGRRRSSLVGGLVTLIAGLHALAPDAARPRTGVAVVLAAVFASLVFLNYIVQTTVVPGLVRPYHPADAPVLGFLTMTNPRSLAWGLEMWGYGFVGIATWLVAPVFGGGRLARATAWTFIANGPISIAGAILTAAWPGWEMTGPGLVAFALWNLLVIAMAALAVATFRSRRATAGCSPG